MRHSTLKVYAVLAVCAIIIFTSCNEDPLGSIPQPDDNEVIGNADSTENANLQGFLDSQADPPMPDPNQYLVQDVETNSIGDTLDCTTQTVNETSNASSQLLLPDRASGFEITAVYDLPSVITGDNTPILNGIGGTRSLSLSTGAYTDTITTGYGFNEVSAGVSSMHSELPSVGQIAQSTSISVKEIFSTQQTAMAVRTTANSWLTDFSAEVGFQSQQYKHTYLITVVVHDFDVKVKYPETPRDWFPNLAKEQYDETFGSYAPVYVSRVGYGKYLAMVIQTDLSALSVESAVSAAVDGLFAGGGFDASGEYASLHQSSRVRAKAVGGRSSSIIALLDGSPNALENYLKEIDEDQSGALAAPLFAEFRFLKDNSKARIVLASDDYVVRNCQVIPSEFMVYDEPELYHNYGTHQVGLGDREFGGDGHPFIDISIYLEIRNNGKEVWLVNETDFIELRRDYSLGEAFSEDTGTKDKLLMTAPTGKQFTRIVSKSEYLNEFKDDSHSVSVFPELGEHPTDILVRKLFVNGDTPGDDIPSPQVFEDRSWMRFTLNPVVVEVR